MDFDCGSVSFFLNNCLLSSADAGSGSGDDGKMSRLPLVLCLAVFPPPPPRPPHLHRLFASLYCLCLHPSPSSKRGWFFFCCFILAHLARLGTLTCPMLLEFFYFMAGEPNMAPVRTQPTRLMFIHWKQQTTSPQCVCLSLPATCVTRQLFANKLTVATLLSCLRRNSLWWLFVPCGDAGQRAGGSGLILFQLPSSRPDVAAAASRR